MPDIFRCRSAGFAGNRMPSADFSQHQHLLHGKMPAARRHTAPLLVTFVATQLCGDAILLKSASTHSILPQQRRRAEDVPRKAAGLHLIGDLYGCANNPQLMTDAAYLEEFCKKAVADAGLTTVGSLFHSFGEGEGVTGVVVLAESHLSLHTWPEDGYVTLDVYVCSYACDNTTKAENLFKTMMIAFDSEDPHLHRVVRA